MSIDSLQVYAQKANTLWTQEKSSLELAINLLSGTAENEYQAFYKLSTVFYIWSIQNASFENEKNQRQQSPVDANSTISTRRKIIDFEIMSK